MSKVNPEKIKILLVDDEPDIIEFMKYNLSREGYEVLTASNGTEALKLNEKHRPQLIILDIMMPAMDGIEACRSIRSNPDYKNTLIAFLTARNEDYSQIAGFDVGADDYINKPIKPSVLTSRIRGLLRRFSDDVADDGIIRIGNLELNKEKYMVSREGRELSLPRKEFELLSLLISKPGKVFTREEIMNRVWGDDVIVGDRTIDVHIRKLREKLGDDYIKTIKGVGYKFDS
jgi:two-component system alkaline phosphatase synthesis response regulator PhoP